MKKFSEIFLELFDQTLPGYDSSKRSGDISFDDKDGNSHVYAFVTEPQNENNEIYDNLAEKFSAKNSDAKLHRILSAIFYEEVFHEYSFKIDNTYVKTGMIKSDAKLANQIFGTTLAFIKKRVEQSEPAAFVFSAANSEPSRVKLYNAMFNRIDSKNYDKFKISDRIETRYIYFDKTVFEDLM